MEQSKAFSTPAAAQAATAILTASGTGSPLFVINLCASMAPITGAAKTLPGFENHRLYQVARAEDGRTRHRLRLGFFTSESDAEKALTTIRAQYPTAFTACLGDEDKKFTRGFVTEAAPAPVAAAPKPQIAVIVDNDSTRPQMKALQIDTPPTAAQPVAASPASAPKVAAPDAKPTAPAANQVSSKTAATPVTAPPVVSTTVPVPKAPSVNAAKPAPAVAKPVAGKPSHEPVEIEITFAQPALKLPATPATESKPAPLPASAAKTQQPAAAAKAAAPVAPPVASAPVAKPANAAPVKVDALELAAPGPRLSTGATGQHRGIVATKVPALESIDLALASDTMTARLTAKPASTAAAKPANQPFHVGQGVAVPTTNLTLDSDQRAPAAKPPANPSRQQAAAAQAAAPKVAATAKPAIPAAPKVDTAPFGKGDLDSTQTIRALTDAEMADETQEKWFAIQLAVSEQPVNLDAMPHLDIFEAYRLYSVATAGSGKITHSLRIGFFREHVSAEAVSGYLKTFFPNPSIVRISVAEHARFKEPLEIPAAAGDAAESNVVAISEARARKPSVIPTVTMEVATPNSGATGSFKPNATGAFKPNATRAFKPNATGAFKPNATGSFKPNATGAFKPDATGSFKPNATGSFKPNATGKHKIAAKGAPGPTKRSPLATGKYQALPKKKLSEELIDEAREVELAESGIRQLPKGGSLLSRLVGKLSK